MVAQRDAKHKLVWYENDAKYEAMGAAEIPKYTSNGRASWSR